MGRGAPQLAHLNRTSDYGSLYSYSGKHVQLYNHFNTLPWKIVVCTPLKVEYFIGILP